MNIPATQGIELNIQEKGMGERIWITEHSRGDEKYGTVHKDYILAKRDGYLKPKIQK